MYFLFVFFFSDRSLPEQTVATWNLTNFNINLSYCNLIVLLLFRMDTVHLHLVSLWQTAHITWLSFFNIPAQVWCASLWMFFFSVVDFSDCQIKGTESLKTHYYIIIIIIIHRHCTDWCAKPTFTLTRDVVVLTSSAAKSLTKHHQLSVWWDEILLGNCWLASWPNHTQSSGRMCFHHARVTHTLTHLVSLESKPSIFPVHWCFREPYFPEFVRCNQTADVTARHVKSVGFFRLTSPEPTCRPGSGVLDPSLGFENVALFFISLLIFVFPASDGKLVTYTYILYIKQWVS